MSLRRGVYQSNRLIVERRTTLMIRRMKTPIEATPSFPGERRIGPSVGLGTRSGLFSTVNSKKWREKFKQEM